MKIHSIFFASTLHLRLYPLLITHWQFYLLGVPSGVFIYMQAIMVGWLAKQSQELSSRDESVIWI